jgi:DNA (cytosine-5)-methyltransferase 3A
MVNAEKKAYTLTASYQGAVEKNSVEKKQRTMVKIGQLDGKNYTQGSGVYSPEGKSCSLTAKGGGVGSYTGLYKIGHIGNSDAQANRVYSPDGKSCTLSANGGGLGAKTGLYKVEEQNTIRKLTPLECERLQSLPDGYTDYVSNTQRYKCLGNAFNAEVIAHILQSIQK